MLVIHPDECIDCGVCEPECPVEAIKADTDPNFNDTGIFLFCVEGFTVSSIARSTTRYTESFPFFPAMV
jgi:ferredoxin